MEETELKKQRGRPSTGPRLLPYVPTADLQRRLEQMASLAAALTSLGVDFSDSLSYAYAPRNANRAAHEKGGMRVLRKHYALQIHGCPPAAIVSLYCLQFDSLHAAVDAVPPSMS